jgi:cell division septum initiation protein DivIVA
MENKKKEELAFKEEMPHSNSSNRNVLQEKLIINYNKLKSKYEKKVKENKFLKDSLESAITSIKNFEESFKSIQFLHVQVKDMASNLKKSPSIQDFSTTEATQINRQTNFKVPEVSMISSNSPNNNAHLLKKLEEFEIHYNEMSKNFNNLVVKYKLLHEEKLKLEDNRMKILNSYSQLEKQQDLTIRELYSRYEEIKRYKEIDKCLVDFTLNSFMLKIDPRDNKINSGDHGIKCEPLPTFAKFLANKK